MWRTSRHAPPFLGSTGCTPTKGERRRERERAHSLRLHVRIQYALWPSKGPYVGILRDNYNNIKQNIKETLDPNKGLASPVNAAAIAAQARECGDAYARSYNRH